MAAVLSPMLIIALISVTGQKTASERACLRVRFLLPVTLLLPILAWSAAGSVDQISAVDFGLLAGKPAWVHSPIIAIFGSCFWLPAFPIGGISICLRAQRYVAQHSDNRPRCAKCDYLLIGLPEPRCPECGERFDSDDIA